MRIKKGKRSNETNNKPEEHRVLAESKEGLSRELVMNQISAKIPSMRELPLS